MERPDPASKQSAEPVWYIPIAVYTVLTPDDGQRNCPKHVEFFLILDFRRVLNIVNFL